MEGQQLITVPPAIELLLAISTENSLWPEELQDNPKIIAQAKMRRNLFEKLDKLFKQIPQATTEITQAIDLGKTDPKTVTEIYELLTDFLDADPYHKRLVLYLPLELLPNKTWQPLSNKLVKSINRFVGSYMMCWHELLKVNDVRANFIDGNILESELSPNGQSMVCKAAHLIPKLAQKGLISATEVQDLLNNCQNEILKESIVNTLPFLADMSFIYYGQTDKQKNMKGEVGENATDWLIKLPDNAEFELKKIEMRAALDLSRGIPKPRVAWERQERENVLIEKYADIIVAMLVKGSLITEDTRIFLLSTSDKIPCLAVINGIRKTIELVARDNLKKAKDIFLSHKDNIKHLWLQDVPETRDALTSMFSRLANLGVTDAAYTRKEFGIKLPQLDAPTLNSDIEAEIRELEPAIKSVATNRQISKLIYPVVLFFGSRLKGYAKRNADLDIAVFVRPGVPKNKHPEIRQMLSRIFSNKKIDGKIVQFWLEKEHDKLKIKDFPDADVALADSTWIHLLFAGVWLGEESAIHELYAKLLPRFIYSKGITFEDHDARSIWLDEMEREVLQYRLMHKGYKRLYPEQGGIHDKHADGLDWQSSFWDSGYRRLATKLFITRVFLPQLEDNKGQSV